MDDEEHRVLVERLLKLERRVFGFQNEQWLNQQLPEPIDYRLKALIDQTNSKFEDSFKEFLSKYKSSPLYNPSATKATPYALGSQAQLDLLKAGHMSIEKTIRQLEEVERLKGCINTEKIRNIGEYNRRVARLEPGFIDVMERAQALHKRVGSITDKYDFMIDAISEKLFRWDATLRAWENKERG